MKIHVLIMHTDATHRIVHQKVDGKGRHILIYLPIVQFFVNATDDLSRYFLVQQKPERLSDGEFLFVWLTARIHVLVKAFNHTYECKIKLTPRPTCRFTMFKSFVFSFNRVRSELEICSCICTLLFPTYIPNPHTHTDH